MKGDGRTGALSLVDSSEERIASMLRKKGFSANDAGDGSGDQTAYHILKAGSAIKKGTF